MEISVGDKVVITEHYLANYPDWGPIVKDKEAIVKAVKEKVIKLKDMLDKDDRALFRSVYGQQDQYTLIEMMIEIDKSLYMVSQFGFKKV